MNQNELELMLGKEETFAETLKDYLISHVNELSKVFPNMTKTEIFDYIKRLMVA